MTLCIASVNYSRSQLGVRCGPRYEWVDTLPTQKDPEVVPFRITYQAQRQGRPVSLTLLDDQ